MPLNDAHFGGYFGAGITLNGDGTMLVAANSIDILIYQNQGLIYTLSASIPLSYSSTSSTSKNLRLKLNSTGNVLVVGWPNNTSYGSYAGSADAYRFVSGSWVKIPGFNLYGNNLTSSSTAIRELGGNVDINSAGTRVIVCAPGPLNSSDRGSAQIWNLPTLT